MAARTLFERLSLPADGPGGASDGDVVASILANLGQVMNSRAGCAETRPDYGMPDFNDLVGRFPDAIPIIAEAVRSQIAAFEPRLRDVQVRHLPDPDRPLDLRYQISGRVGEPGSELSISFDTVVGDDGHTFIR